MNSDFDGLVEYMHVTCLPANQKSVLRGANVPVGVSIDDVAELHTWKANAIRYRIAPRTVWDGGADSVAQYQQDFLFEVQRAVFECMKILFFCAEAGVEVIIDLQHPPGRVVRVPGSAERVFTEPWARNLFLQSWDMIASQLSAYSAVWGYEILGAPAGSTAAWRELAMVTMQRIRRFDASARFIVQAVGGHPHRLEELVPFGPDSNVIYGVQMYAPRPFTHQPLTRLDNYEYPGRIDGEKWNYRRIKSYLAPVRRYQREHRVPILLSEFGAARFGRGAVAYTADVIRLAERNGWSWTYSEFRGANAWDLERGDLPNSARLVYSKAQEMIRKCLGRNAA